jgi:hypothetical protein
MRFSRISVWLMLLAANPCAWSVQQKMGQPVRLRDLVEVDHEIILLSDLLPPNVPSALKSASDAIRLGHAPLMGCVRILDPEQIKHQLAADPTLLAVFRMPTKITIRRFKWLIKNAAVRSAVSVFLQQWKSKYGSLPDPATLQLDNPGALQEDPALVVAGMDWDDWRQDLQLRLRCANRALCGSFLAHAGWPSDLAAKWRAKLHPENFSSGTGAASNGSSSAPALTEIGKPATLILEGAGLRISIPVVCLGRGALNQQVRVLDVRTHRVFDAEVVGSGLLRASL